MTDTTIKEPPNSHMLLALDALFTISLSADIGMTIASLGGHPKPATDGHLKTGHHT